MSKLGRSILLPFLALAGGANSVSAQSSAVQVQVYDYAALEPETLRHFISSFESIWVQAGLPLQVSICRGSLAIPCPSQPGNPDPLVIRLMPGYPKTANDARRPPLGHSFTNQEGGGYSSVFLDAVKDQATAASVAWVVVLAYASAHEMGHLLLGTQAHTPRGPMKGTWDRSDYQAMAQNDFRFTDQQIRQMARRSGATLSAQAQKGL